MSRINRPEMFTDHYADLPPWCRFGARLLEENDAGYDRKYEPRTVVGITKTQVVCVWGHDPDRADAVEIRYRRSNLGRIAVGTMYNGNSLVNPLAQHVRDRLAVLATDRLYYEIARLHREQFTHAARDERPHTVAAALAVLDQLAEMVATTRGAIVDRETEAAARAATAVIIAAREG